MKRVMVMVLLVTSTAYGDAARDKATSVALFEEGRRLAAGGKYAQACPKFEASLELVPGIGTQLNLADCYEHLGRIASAWTTFRDAQVAADKAGDSRAAFAKQRMDALESRLSRLTITLGPGANVAGLVLERDGEEVHSAIVDVAIPVDPGDHTVKASAPGHKPWSGTVTVSPGAKMSVEVPALAANAVLPLKEGVKESAGVPDQAPLTADEPGRGNGPRVASYVIMGAGGALVIAGTAFGLAARSTYNDAKTGGHCDPNLVCDMAGVDEVNSAHRKAATSTVLFVTGAAAIAGGIVLYITLPPMKGGAERAIQIIPGAGSLTVAGTF
jgi:hypothetical protein